MKIISPVVSYLSQVLGEMQKVAFPTFSQTARRTALVVISIIVGTIFLALADAGITQLVKIFILK